MSVGYEETVCLSLFLLAGLLADYIIRDQCLVSTPPLATGWERGLPGAAYPVILTYFTDHVRRVGCRECWV